MLLFKKEIMHLPKLTLERRGFRRFGRDQGIGVCLGQREVPEHKSQLFPQRLLHLFYDGIGGPAVRALIIAVFHQSYRRIGRSFSVVAG